MVWMLPAPVRRVPRPVRRVTVAGDEKKPERLDSPGDDTPCLAAGEPILSGSLFDVSSSTIFIVATPAKQSSVFS